MSLMAEIEKLMNNVDSSVCYRVINLGGKKLYIEGIKSIVRLETEEIIFQLKKQCIVVSGYNLKVKYLDKNSCVISGEILSVVQK